MARVSGIDGSGLNLPKGSKQLLKAFPPPSNQKGPCKRPQALLVGLVDLWAGVCRGVQIMTLKQGELAGAKALISQLGPRDLLLGDRNFPHYEIMSRIRAAGAHFLMRMSTRYLLDSKHERTYLGPDEWLVTLKKSNRLAKLYPEMPETMTVRILRYQLVGYQVSYLITSLLDHEAYPYKELVALYHERWQHETRHNEWKHALKMSNLRSKSEDGIRKEVFAQLTLNNAIRWVMSDAAKPPVRPVDLKFLDSKRLTVTAAARMASASPHELPAWYESLTLQVAKLRILVRPNRSYPRRRSNTVGRLKGNGRRAQPAKLPPPGSDPPTVTLAQSETVA